MESDPPTPSSETEVEEDPMPVTSFARRSLSLISIEPAIFLGTLGYGLSSIISQNLLIDKVCLVNLKYDPAICSNLTSFKDNEKEVEKITASINMYLNILTAIPAVIVSLFLGPWSDVNGRKPLMIIPQIGTILAQLMFVINTYLTYLPGEFILLASIGSLFGGFTAFLIGMYSYIADVSSGRSRTSRIALVDLFMFLGFPFGTFISGPLFKYGGYYAVFGLGIGFTFISAVYVMLFINDTRGPYSNCTERNQSFDIIGAFSIWNVIEVFKTCFKSRDNYARPILMLLISAMLFNLSTISGSSLIYYLTRLKFGWDEQDFTVWVAISSMSSSFATLCVMPLLSYKLRLHDATIGIIGSVFGVASNLVRTFAQVSWLFYLSSAVGLIAQAPAIVIRSYISKVVPADELGSVFSMVASLEACVPLVTSPLFTYVYQQTIDTFPSAILFISAALYLLITINLSIVSTLVRMARPDIQSNIESEETAVIIDNEVLPIIHGIEDD